MEKDSFQTQLDYQRMTSEFTLPFELCSRETQIERMNATRTSNTQADLNVCQAADDIIEIFEKLGFTSDTPPDIELLRHSIVEAIQKRTTLKAIHEGK